MERNENLQSSLQFSTNPLKTASFQENNDKRYSEIKYQIDQILKKYENTSDLLKLSENLQKLNQQITDFFLKNQQILPVTVINVFFY